MKQIQRLSLLALTIVAFCISSAAQNTDSIDADIQLMLQKAHQYRIGTTVEQDYEKSFRLFLHCANEGSPMGMNAVGIMYKDGIGCTQNYKKATIWFEKAGEAGYAKGYYNLAMMYKFGTGVDLNLRKALNYFLLCADAGDAGGMYGAGYMLYRGQGAKQDYTKAFDLFKRGATAGRVSCMYNLGLCYRNGYGTEKNTEKAKEWLIKAAEMGYQFAEDELQNPVAENEYFTNNKKKNKANDVDSLKSYKRIPKNKKTVSLDGTWHGTKITYDFSGKHIIRKDKVELKLTQQGLLITGVWTENDSSNIKLEGTIADNTLLFAKGSSVRANRYKKSLKWNMQQGRFQAQQSEGKIVLAGNIREFTSDYMEHGPPVYILLEQEQQLMVDTTPEEVSFKSASDESNKLVVANYTTLAEAKVYPNPFTYSFTIDYTLETPGKVVIHLCDLQGKVVSVLENANKQAGTHSITDGYNLPTGTYLVNIMLDGQKLYKSKLIIKTN